MISVYGLFELCIIIMLRIIRLEIRDEENKLK